MRDWNRVRQRKKFPMNIASHLVNDDMNEEDVALVYAMMMKSIIVEIIEMTEPSIKISDHGDYILEAIKSTILMTGKVLNLVDEAENISKVEESSGNLTDLIYIKITDLQLAINENVSESTPPMTSTNDLFKNYLTYALDGLPEAQFAFDDDLVLTSEPDMFYLKQIAKLIRETPTNHLEMYLWWTVIEDMIPYTTTELRHIYFSHVKALFGVDAESASRSSYCASATNKLMGPAVSSLFVDDRFLADVKPQVAIMLDNIKGAFESLAERAEWMDSETRVKTLQKLRKMGVFIGFPELVLNETLLDDFYLGVSMRIHQSVKNQH